MGDFIRDVDGQVWARTQGVAAFVLGVHERTLRKMLARGAPKVRRGKGYDLVAIRAWMAEQAGDDVDGELADDGGESFKAAELRRARARASMEELRLAEKKGALVDRDEYLVGRRSLVAWFVAVMERAESELATRIAASIAGAKIGQVRKVTRAYFDQVRRDAAER